VQQACGTGLEAAILVANKIALGQIDAGVAGGVDTTSDVTIRGRLGQFGTGVIKSTADEMIKDFAQCLSVSLRGEGMTVGTASNALTARGLLLVILRGLVARLRELVGRLTHRIRNR
jgi:acetyl-CoA acetyltransferase